MVEYGCDYDALEHFAKIVRPSRNWHGAQIAMLTACFDASGHESDQRFLVVGGFVSSADDWIEFTRRWNDRLKDNGIPYFRATECEYNTNAFWGWKNKEKEKRKLKEDLLEIIHSCTYRKFVSIVEIKALKSNLTEQKRKDCYLRAYALAGRTCAARVREWSVSWSSRYVPELVFEDGDLRKEELEKRLLEDGFARPHFRPKKNVLTKDGQTIPGFVPLQAADFLAYEFFLAAKSGNYNRWEIQEFYNKPGPMGIYTVSDITELDRMLDVSAAALQLEKLVTPKAERT